MIRSSVDPVPALLGTLARAGIKLQLAGDGRLGVAAPPGALSAELRAEIAEHKPGLIQWLAATDGSDAEEGLSKLVPDPANLFEPFAPSDLQQSFLIGSREGFEFHVRPHQYIEMDLEDFDPQRFAVAMNAAVRRQRKNVVVARDDLSLQVVRELAPVQVVVEDFRSLPPHEAAAQLGRVRARIEREEPPHDRWPWLRPHVSLYGGNRARLHYNNNSLFTDAPSGVGLMNDALHYYYHPDQPLPEIDISYRDCVLALAKLEESPTGLAAKDYWCERMADWPDAPQVPLVAGNRFRGRSRLSRRDWVVEASLWGQLRRQAEKRGLSTTSTLLGLHSEVLAYWSGSRHFLLNNMISHRQFELHPQMHSVLGNFASLYPLEIDWRPDEPFRARVQRLQARVLADVAHAQWSGVKVLQTLNQVRRTPGRASCPFAVGSALFVGSAQRPYYSLLETPQTLIDTEYWQLGGDQLWVIWDVIEEMFPAGLVDAMFDAYREVFVRLATDPSAWDLSSFELLPSPQRALRTSLNSSRPAAAAGTLLHDGLAHHAAAQPDRPAVVTAEASLEYRKLHSRSTALAERLREHGAGPGEIVAVLLPKGCEQIVAVFGVLGSGAAYVPVDPTWPPERRRFLLADAAVCAVLTSTELCTELPEDTGVPVICVDTVGEERGAGSGSRPRQHPDDLAYVIYTSGSTGRPKGAMLDHRGPANTIADINERFHVTAADVLFGVSSLCFDLSVYDIFGAAAAGATLVLPSGPDPTSWIDEVRDRGVTVWNSVPAIMQLFVEEAARQGVSFPALRTVLLSGDWIPIDLPERILRVAPQARVVSLGGATEASIWSIFHPIDRVDPEWTSIPYGRPLAGQSWHVLDPVGRDAPIWVAGDLYIGGAGVARGYLNDAEKTAAAFVSHPRTGERLYRTGDRGRFLPAGEIEFLGRSDFQVKIQGFRVEPGEVEHILRAHSDVEQAVVLARESGAGKQLVAFVVGREGEAAPEPETLRVHLAARLPGYLVPSRISVLDRLPLTSNGKLDRAALVAADPERGAGEQASFTAPRDVAEARLAEIWESVLATGPVGVHDDFFELGGQSFAALRVIGQIAQSLRRRVPLSVLLERPTVAQLAAWLEEGSDPSWTPLVRLREPGPGQPWFFVHPAGGSVLCYRALADRLVRPSFAFEAPSPANGRPVVETVEDYAQLYLESLLEAQPQGPYFLAGWSSGAVIAAQLAHQLEQAGRVVERLLVIDAPAPVAPRPVDEIMSLLWFLEDLELGFDATLIGTPERARLAAAAPAERLSLGLELVAAQGCDRLAVDPSDLRSPLAVFASVVGACNDHAAPPIGADVTVVRAEQSVVGEFADDPSAGEADWGWSAVTSGRTDALAVRGTHYTLLKEPRAIGAIADVLNRR